MVLVVFLVVGGHKWRGLDFVEFGGWRVLLVVMEFLIVGFLRLFASFGGWKRRFLMRVVEFVGDLGNRRKVMWVDDGILHTKNFCAVCTCV